MSTLSKKNRAIPILGLGFEESQLQILYLRPKNGGCQVQGSILIPFENNPLTANPEELGRDIRRQLEEAGLRERRCAVSLPLSWVSTVATSLPDVPEADVQGFLDIEAERGFLFAQDSLSICHSRIRCPQGGRHATLVAISKNKLQFLDRILKAAKLKPVSFTLGLTAQQSPDFETSIGVLALAIRNQTVELQITCGGGVAVLRSLDVIVPQENGPAQIDVVALRREIRITLGEMPDELRTMVRKARVFGDANMAGPLVNDLTGTLESLGLSCDPVSLAEETPLKGLVAADQPCCPALSVGINGLRRIPAPLEFLPPKVSAWRRTSDKVNSKKMAWAGAAVAAVVLLVGGLFAYQQWQLSRLQTQWNAMSSTVEELGTVQARIKQFRPWFDSSFPGLRILRGITEAFPETGVVTAKMIEIRNLSTVSCTGEAAHRQAILDMLDKLSAADEVHQLKVDQIRGKDSMQFTIHYQWGSGGAGE